MTGFIEPLRIGPETLAQGAPDGPLTGVTVAVKDIVDVAGITTGAGNPDWLATHEPAERHAPAVQRLLDAGATVIGKAHTDEFAWSLSGTNHHYGTPRNPAAPGRVPGGSSSGSASAVALGVAELAIGTDTAGSIRVPASYCGLYGIRPSHGRVPVKGILPLAWSFDTCGLFAADGELLQRAARVLLESSGHRATAGPAEPLRSLVLATDLVEMADPAVAAAVRDGAAQLTDELGIALIQTSFGADRIPAWLQAFRARQMVERGRLTAAGSPPTGRGSDRGSPAASPPPRRRSRARRSRRRRPVSKSGVRLSTRSPTMRRWCCRRPPPSRRRRISTRRRTRIFARGRSG